MGWWEGGSRGGVYIHIGLIHLLVQQNLSQHCKAIILQLKKKKQPKLSIRWRPAEAGAPGMAMCFTILEINQEVQFPTSRQHN